MSFNLNTFLAIFSIYAVGLVLAQLFLKQMVFAFMKNVNAAVIIAVATLAAWAAVIYAFPVEGIIVFVIGAATEAGIGYYRRKQLTNFFAGMGYTAGKN